MEDDQDDLVRGRAAKRAAEGDVAFVRELGVRLARRRIRGPGHWPYATRRRRPRSWNG